MEFVGQTTKIAKCGNCGFQISFIEWCGLDDDWSHDDNGRPECPGSPVAAPMLDTIQPVNEYGHIMTPCRCPEGPHEGARMSKIPRFCERCGHIVSPVIPQPIVGFMMGVKNVIQPTPEQVAMSRDRLSIPDDWDWMECSMQCGDLVWLSPGMLEAIKEQKDYPVRQVCSSACAMAMIERENLA